MPSPSRVLSRRAALQAAGVAASSLAIATPDTLARQAATPAPPAEGISPGTVQRSVDALDSIVAGVMDRTGVPGVPVAVVYRDETLATRGYGVASTETGAPVDADTIFQIASLSKPIASTIVASIVADGALTWDTPVADHLSGFALYEPWPTSQVTIRDMFCHRSGLADHAGDDLEDMGYDRGEVLHRLRYLRPKSSFRSAYAYTNFGLTAGAVAASTAAGQEWEEAAAARLYQPAGMTRTSSRFSDYVEADNRAAGHVRKGDAWLPEFVRDPDAQSPAGGVSSTATDMARWLRLQLGGGTLDGEEIVPADALAETHRVQMIRTIVDDPAVDRAGFYGLGWNVSYDDHGAVQLSHSGAFALGTGTTVYMYPAAGLGIAVLANGAANGTAEAIAISFLDVARFGSVQNDYVTILGPIFAADMVPDYVTDIDYSAPPTGALPPQDLAIYTGTWHSLVYGPMEIAEDGDGLTLSQGPADDPDVYPLTPWNRDTFTYLPIGENENYPAAVTFTIGPDGVASTVTVENLDVHQQGTFTRDAPGTP